ncbi:hypothetical protein DESUT3_09930 [Desulfuromonas versatilis]|uniref:DUF4445 domain-containing protein n=1 Tax=Desulfuromonas versatilis TaxID=2802975 RepID=A0ABN6DWM7_9BACT|nr:ASKHA domain-containing protein [Desulfuromonas versatilis]BCR03924.1 hypothetical protein DESUT3_09930 [Desulfuromonas versatilis]
MRSEEWRASGSGLRLGLDLGTTTLAGRLIDGAGKCLAEGKLANPQSAFGSDIIRRLEAARGGNAQKLQALLAQGIGGLIDDLLARAGRSRGEIAAAAAAGNPGICHLLRGLEVDSVLFPPHRPPDCAGVHLEPRGLGLDLPVSLYLFPLVSGYVGGDLVAFLFAEPEPAASTFFLDVGTNGEMALFADGRWWTTSVAAGPAFEGGGISCGMAAKAGAVEQVRLDGDRLRLGVIGGGAPRGLCGSGLVEAVAAALEGGLMDPRGTLRDPGEVASHLSRYLVESPEGNALRLYRDASVELRLTQEDVRNFQLAKGAVQAGALCLLRRAGVAPEDLAAVVVTGAFGFSLASAALKRVAMLPETMVDKVRFVPGGALAGVCRLLADPEGPARAQALADRLKPYPLSGTPAFEQAFLAALDF